MERQTRKVKEQRAFHSPLNAGRNTLKTSFCLFYIEISLKLPAIELSSPYSQAWESSCSVLMRVDTSEERRPSETRWVWSNILLYFASLWKHSFANCWCWLTRWSLFQRKIFREGEQMQACNSPLDHNATWNQRQTKHPDSELTVTDVS